MTPDAPPGIPAPVARRAVEWLLEAQFADTPEQVRQAIDDWCREHPDHLRAWQHIEQVNRHFSPLASSLAPQVTRQILASPRLSRRGTLKGLSLLLAAGGSGYLVANGQSWHPWLADQRTGVGEQRRISLPDAGLVILNSGTSLDIRYSDTERRLHLLRGEIHIRTAPDPAGRPFYVETAEGRLQPIGTRFSVRQLERRSRVEVYQGAVRVQPGELPHATRLDAGQGLDFSRAGLSPRRDVQPSDAAWTQGMIVASGMPLAEFVAELSRHRHGIVRCDPSIARLKVSGTYPIGHGDQALQALSEALPIRVRRVTPYWISLLPAD